MMCVMSLICINCILKIQFYLFYSFNFYGHIKALYYLTRSYFLLFQECKGKVFSVWYCGEWSKWNWCRQVSNYDAGIQFSYLNVMCIFPSSIPSFLFPFCCLQVRKLVVRFDYIVRDSRACGLGCNFQFQRCLFDLLQNSSTCTRSNIYKQAAWR